MRLFVGIIMCLIIATIVVVVVVRFGSGSPLALFLQSPAVATSSPMFLEFSPGSGSLGALFFLFCVFNKLSVLSLNLVVEAVVEFLFTLMSPCEGAAPRRCGLPVSGGGSAQKGRR